MRARCVITEHLGDRRKSPVWSTEATYPLGSTAGVPEERSAALIYAGAPVRIGTGPGQVVNCKKGLLKEACATCCAGLDIRNTQCQQWGAAPLPNPGEPCT
jgi:hypothetical protein